MAPHCVRPTQFVCAWLLNATVARTISNSNLHLLLLGQLRLAIQWSRTEIQLSGVTISQQREAVAHMTEVKDIKLDVKKATDVYNLVIFK